MEVKSDKNPQKIGGEIDPKIDAFQQRLSTSKSQLVQTDIMGEGHSSRQCGSFLILSLSFLFLLTLVLNMFVQENTVTVVQEFHRPLPMRDDSLEPVISHEVPARKVPKDCQPQTKLAFAKTHKTGGMFPHSRV